MCNRVPSATSHNCDRMFFFSYTQTNRPPLSSRDTFSCINGWNHHLYYYQTFLPIAPLVPPSRPSTFFMFRIFFFPLINYSPLMFVSFQKKKYYFRFITCSPHTYTTPTQQVPGVARAAAATHRRPRPARTAASTPRTTERPPTRRRPTRTRTRASPWRLRKFARKR